MNYKTQQKEQILRYLQFRAGQHITAQDMARDFAAQGMPISLATIYRCLDQLINEGTLRKYTMDTRTSACYEYLPDSYACKRHFHLKCTQCEMLYHVTCETLCGLEEHLLAHHGFQIDQSRTVLYGICKACRDKKTPS